MKLVQVKCQNCGATMMVPEGSTRIKCEYCDSVFTLDDEASHIKFDNAKQAGYEFERGRIRAQKEEAARRNREAYDQRREDQSYDNRRTYDYKNNSYRRSRDWGCPVGEQRPRRCGSLRSRPRKRQTGGHSHHHGQGWKLHIQL